MEPSVAWHTVGPGVALQGNLDPDILYGGREVIVREVKGTRGDRRGSRTWDTVLHPELALRTFFKCVHGYSAN